MSAPPKKVGLKGAAGKKGGVDAKKRKNATAPATETNLKKRGLFSKDLRLMMYGYGDAAAPYNETVDLIEDIVVDYISSLTHKALAGAAGKGGRMLPEDLLFLLRKDIDLAAVGQDPHKFARAQELLRMNEEIKKAKKAFDADDKLMDEDD